MFSRLYIANNVHDVDLHHFFPTWEPFLSPSLSDYEDTKLGKSLTCSNRTWCHTMTVLAWRRNLTRSPLAVQSFWIWMILMLEKSLWLTSRTWQTMYDIENSLKSHFKEILCYGVRDLPFTRCRLKSHNSLLFLFMRSTRSFVKTHVAVLLQVSSSCLWRQRLLLLPPYQKTF